MTLSSTEVASRYLDLGGPDIYLWLHTATTPSREVWDEHIERMREAIAQRKSSSPILSMVITDGATPGARERSIIFKDTLSLPGTRFAAVSLLLSNPLTRGVATAISWVNPGFRAFQPSATHEAFAYLGITQHAQAVLDVYDEMQRTLPPNATLAEIHQMQRRRLRA